MQTEDFINQVPDGVLQKTEIHQCNNVVLFKPMVYMGGVEFDVTDYHIVIPSESTPDLLINNKMTHGERMKIMTVNPGDAVSCIKNAPAKPYYSLLVKPEFLRRVAEEMGHSGEIRFGHSLNPYSAELLQLSKSLEQESLRPDRLSLLLDSLEIQLAAYLLRSYKTNMMLKDQPLQNTDFYVGRAVDYIQSYFNANITLNDICGEVHVSLYHFIRMFKKKTGMTPHRYLMKVRTEKAGELLKSKNCSVAETAVLCGFESASHFSCAFKKMTGYSPAEYKSRN
jgi:AraC-like DNA-binding protein